MGAGKPKWHYTMCVLRLQVRSGGGGGVTAHIYCISIILEREDAYLGLKQKGEKWRGRGVIHNQEKPEW